MKRVRGGSVVYIIETCQGIKTTKITTIETYIHLTIMADLSTLTIITNKQPEQFFNNKTNHEIDQSLDSLIEILNDVDETRKDKIKALVVLSN